MFNVIHFHLLIFKGWYTIFKPHFEIMYSICMPNKDSICTLTQSNHSLHCLPETPWALGYPKSTREEAYQTVRRFTVWSVSSRGTWSILFHVSEPLSLLTLEHKVQGSNPVSGRIQLINVLCFISQSFIASPSSSLFDLMLSTLSKISADDILKHFLYFSQKQDWTFHANCLQCFLGKISPVYRLLN